MRSLQLMAAMDERRRTTRYSCNAEVGLSAAVVGSPGRQVQLRNISVGGVEAVVDWEVGPGKLLTVELFNAVRGCWYLKMMRVIYVVPNDGDTWRIGCSFSHPLSDDELGGLLGVHRPFHRMTGSR